MGKVIQFPTGRARRQAHVTPAGLEPRATAHGVLAPWLAMLDAYVRVWRSFGRGLASSDRTAEGSRESATSR